MNQITQDQGTSIRTLRLTRGSITIPTQPNRCRELRLKSRQGPQAARETKIKQRPELSQVVLDGRAGENQTMNGGQLLGTDCYLWERRKGGRKGGREVDK